MGIEYIVDNFHGIVMKYIRRNYYSIDYVISDLNKKKYKKYGLCIKSEKQLVNGVEYDRLCLISEVEELDFSWTLFLICEPNVRYRDGFYCHISGKEPETNGLYPWINYDML